MKLIDIILFVPIFPIAFHDKSQNKLKPRKKNHCVFLASQRFLIQGFKQESDLVRFRVTTTAQEAPCFSLTFLQANIIQDGGSQSELHFSKYLFSHFTERKKIPLHDAVSSAFENIQYHPQNCLHPLLCLREKELLKLRFLNSISPTFSLWFIPVSAGEKFLSSTDSFWTPKPQPKLRLTEHFPWRKGSHLAPWIITPTKFLERIIYCTKTVLCVNDWMTKIVFSIWFSGSLPLSLNSTLFYYDRIFSKTFWPLCLFHWMDLEPQKVTKKKKHWKH